MLNKILNSLFGYKKSGIKTVEVGKAQILFFNKKESYVKTVYGESTTTLGSIFSLYVDHNIDLALRTKEIKCDCGAVIYPKKTKYKYQILKKESFERIYEEGYTTFFGFKGSDVYTPILVPDSSTPH